MSARVLFVGLDAAEPLLLRAGAASGDLPTIARLSALGVSGALENCMTTLPGAVWPEIVSGIGCGRLSRFFHPRQVITGEAAPRSLTAKDVAGDPTFWKTASEAGRRVAVVDIPHVPLAASLNGVQVAEYGLHDSHFGAASHPVGLFDQLTRAHGRYPVASCDHYGGSEAANLRLLDDLLEGIERKTHLLLDVMERERWDLFACAFSEAHCGGHWFWHFTDPTHRAFTRDAPKRLSDAIHTIYARLDAAVGLLMDAAGAETVIVLASHGMAPYVAGYQILPEVIARLGLSSGGGGPSLVRNLQHTLKHWIPRRYWERLGHLVVEQRVARTLLRPFQRGSAAMFFPLESSATKAVYVPNNTIGAVRLNLRGREPFGSVSPGAEADALLDDIRSELLALRQPESGELIVASAATATETFGPVHHPDVPDVIVRFRQDLGLLETCESSRIGSVRVAVGSRWGRRSGDHSLRSAVWLQGRPFPTGAALDRGSLIDVAPTLLDALSCELPAFLEGRTLRPRTA